MAAMVLETGVTRAARLDGSILEDRTTCYRGFIDEKSQTLVSSLGETVAGGVAKPSLGFLMGEMDTTSSHAERLTRRPGFLAGPFVTRSILCLGRATECWKS